MPFTAAFCASPLVLVASSATAPFAQPLKMGNLTLRSGLILSPMEGVSCVGFRRLCYAQGASLVWTEMVRAAGLQRNNGATFDLIDTFDPDVPTGLQLMARNQPLTPRLSRCTRAHRRRTIAHLPITGEEPR